MAGTSVFDNLPRIAFGPAAMKYQHPKWMDSLRVPFVNQKLEQYYYYPRCKNEWMDSIIQAIKVGYRILDYSHTYGSYYAFGQAIQKSSVSREDLFITTRVSNIAQKSHTVREEFFAFLKDSKLDYVDLLQFHWPVTDCYLDTWREMESLYKDGYIRHLGVANCHQHHFERILEICNFRPEVVQFELHPLFTQVPLVEYYKSQDVEIESYTSLARMDQRLFNLPLLKNIASAYHKSINQIILRWHIQKGYIPIFRSMNSIHIKENFDVFDFKLTDEEVKRIDSVNINSRLRYDPDNCDFSIL